MLTTRAACLCLVLAVCALGVASLEWEMRGLSSFTVPVFMWSDKQIFSQSQVIDTVTAGDVEFALASLLRMSNTKDSKLATSFNENVAAPEVVILFVEPELRTDQVPYIASAFASTPGGSFSHLKSALEAAGSSLVMPYATVEEVTLLDDSLFNTFESIKEGSIYMSRLPGSELFSRLRNLDSVKIVEIDSLIAELKANNAFGNGVTDLVVVCFDKPVSNKGATFAFHDEVIGELSTSISAATEGNYVAMYAANMPAPSRLIWTFEQHASTEYQRQVYFAEAILANASNCTVNCSNSTGTHVVNYFPGPLIEVFLITAILITMLFTGACAIFSLQTPDKWEAPKTYNKRDI